jgi:hypothetical protein
MSWAVALEGSDDWVEQLRTVGEHWNKSCMRDLQVTHARAALHRLPC